MDHISVIMESNGRKGEAILAAGKTRPDPAQAAFIVDTCHHPAYPPHWAAAFLVRSLLERKLGDGLDVEQALTALKRADLHWSARFQLLQAIRYVPQLGRPYEAEVRAAMDHERTALRMVGLDAFVHLATVDDRLVPEAKARVLAGGEDNMPGIRSRARHMAKVLARLPR
jgi:hypothetical protein